MDLKNWIPITFTEVPKELEGVKLFACNSKTGIAGYGTLVNGLTDHYRTKTGVLVLEDKKFIQLQDERFGGQSFFTVDNYQLTELPKRRFKIYVCSSWRNTYYTNFIKHLQEFADVYDWQNPDSAFSWADIDRNWEQWSPKEYINFLDHPLAEQGFKNDFQGMEWAEVGILLLPAGRSAHTEAGYMRGQGKPVFVLIMDGDHIEPELMYRIYSGVFVSTYDLFEYLKFSLKLD